MERVTESKRRYFAGGDYVTRFSPESEFALCIESPFPKSGWKSRVVAGKTTVVFPGSAVEFEDGYYEVMRQEQGSGKTSYWLKPWEPHFPIRVPFKYNQQECLRAAAEYRLIQKRNKFRIVLLLLSPIAGTLPAPDQTRIANTFGIPAVRLTTASALLLLVPAGYSVINTALWIFGSAFEIIVEGPIWLYLIGCYLFLECMLRLYSSMKLEEPVGSLFVYFPLEVVQTLRSSFSGRSIEHIPDKHRLLVPDDQVNSSPHEEYDLEVTSVLPKDHWNLSTGINFRGACYGLVDSRILTSGNEKYYRYLLKLAPPGVFFKTICNYTPDEVRQLALRKRRRELSTWVDTFAPFWGLLQKEDQQRLQDWYGFNSVKYTRWSVYALGILCLGNAIASIAYMLSGDDRPIDLLVFVISCYFIVESYQRWRRLKMDEPSGSALAVIVRPLASRLLLGQ